MGKSTSATQRNMKTPLVQSIDLIVSIIQSLASTHFYKAFWSYVSIVVVLLAVIALVVAGTNQQFYLHFYKLTNILLHRRFVISQAILKIYLYFFLYCIVHTMIYQSSKEQRIVCHFYEEMANYQHGQCNDNGNVDESPTSTPWYHQGTWWLQHVYTGSVTRYDICYYIPVIFIQATHMHITVQIYLDVRSWHVIANDPCYSMIHCDQFQS